MEWVLIWIFCGIVSASIASAKGRSGCGWFLLGILIGPFGFAVALLPKLEKPPDERGLVKCPFCAEFVKAEAVKCRHCGSDIPVSTQTILAAAKEKKSGISVAGAVVLALLFVIVLTAVINYIRSFM